MRRLRSCSPSNTGRQQERPDGQVREVREGPSRPRLAAVAGELGQRVFENVSAQAWKLWEERQKMILNEYRLMPWQKEAQTLVAKQMEDFFFGEGAALPPGLRPPADEVGGGDLPARAHGTSLSITNRSRACASRSACSTAAASAPCAKMNPR